MLADELDYVIGVDTHRDQHALAIVLWGGRLRADAQARPAFEHGRVGLADLRPLSHLAVSLRRRTDELGS